MTTISCIVPEISNATGNFFLILDYFLPFHLPATRPNNPKNQNFENIKKSPGDIIILHMSAINKNQKSNDV